MTTYIELITRPFLQSLQPRALVIRTPALVNIYLVLNTDRCYFYQYSYVWFLEALIHWVSRATCLIAQHG